MKHDLRVTLMLITFFVLAQIIGISLIGLNVSGVSVVDGTIQVDYSDTALGPRPEMTGAGTFAYIAGGVLIGTLLVLLIIRMKKISLWKIWFFLAVLIAITLALGVIMPAYSAMIIALVLAIIKVFRPNIIVHNLTELLMYAGIAVFLVPLLNLLWAAILLIAISIYDFIAVFKSKHMIKMAKFQTESKVFAGLFIPYKVKNNIKTQSLRAEKNIKQKSKNKTLVKPEAKNAILGGGDIAFPLLFTGAAMQSLVMLGMPLTTAIYHSLIITLFATLAVGFLFVFAKKDKFYPAMPIISAGCFVGYVLIWLII